MFRGHSRLLAYSALALRPRAHRFRARGRSQLRRATAFLGQAISGRWLPLGHRRISRSCFEVHSGLFPALVLNFVADLLSFIETVQSGAFDCGDVNEHVFSAAVWLYEAKALGRVEPLTVPV